MCLPLFTVQCTHKIPRRTRNGLLLSKFKKKLSDSKHRGKKGKISGLLFACAEIKGKVPYKLVD